jgi:hypothetical protein
MNHVSLVKSTTLTGQYVKKHLEAVFAGPVPIIARQTAIYALLKFKKVRANLQRNSDLANGKSSTRALLNSVRRNNILI